jgi:AraC family transcriptional regulator
MLRTGGTERLAFLVNQTHGILLRPENRLHAASDGLGWTSLYASAQGEQPYEASYRAVPDHLVILHLNGPVGVSRTIGATRSHRKVAAGGLFILPGGVDFGVRLEGRLETLHLYLRDAVLREVAADLAGDPDRVVLAPQLGERDIVIEALALEMRDALNSADVATPLYVDYVARVLAARLLRMHSSRCGPLPAAPREGLNRIQISRALEFMQARIDQRLTLAEVAAATGLSETHFARQFKRALGIAPHQKLMNLRVERAKEMLLWGDRAIVEIALACGFAHQEHLTRVFRRTVGSTPAVFRRSARA